MGGLGLVDLLRAEEAARTRSHKAVIMVYLSGGLSHHDSFDMKPEAPAEGDNLRKFLQTFYAELAAGGPA